MVRTLPFHGEKMGSNPIAGINFFTQLLMDFITLKSFIPEIFLSVCILSQLVFNAYMTNSTHNNFPIINKEIFSQVSVILVITLALSLNLKIEGFFNNFLFLNDSSSHLIKILILISTLVTLPSLIKAFKIQRLNFFEFFSILLLAVLSLLLLVNSTDMLSAYLLIEMQALCFYVLASFKRTSAFSVDAGLKYFISGAFISGILLFGCSLVYAALGSLNFNSISLLLSIPFDFFYLKAVLFSGAFLITVTLLFKVSAVPFHFWSPDVYEGAPLATTITFSIIPKFAIFSFFIKWLSILGNNFLDLNAFLMLVGLSSVLIGSLFAIRQKRLKRLVIYSSIAQVGFIISGLSSIDINSTIAVYFFIAIYIISSVLVWNQLTTLYSFREFSLKFYKKVGSPLFIASLSNFYKKNYIWSISFIVIFFSIAGIPPLSGFLSKILILFSLIVSKNILGSLFLVLLSAISVFYYLRVIKTVFFESKLNFYTNEEFQVVFLSSFFLIDCFVISVCLFLLFFFFFNPALLLLLCHNITLGSAFF